MKVTSTKASFYMRVPLAKRGIALQHKYLCGFCDEVKKIGLPWQGFYDSYFHQPTLAITFKVTAIFNQTPCKGTGSQVTAIL